jgi:hypothetical protein
MPHPLDAIPDVMATVESRTGRDGLVQVRQPRLYTGGLSRRLARLVRWRADVIIQLDEYGSFYWRQINGQRSLDELATQFSERFGRTPEESRRAVLQFTRELLARRLVYLKQPEPVP